MTPIDKFESLFIVTEFRTIITRERLSITFEESAAAHLGMLTLTSILAEAFLVPAEWGL